MFTIVKENEQIAFTLVSDLSDVEPLVSQFCELAPEWGIENSARVALVLRALLSCVVSGGSQQAQSPKVYCWIERTPEGPFKISVEDDGAGYSFTRLHAMDAHEEPEGQYPGHETLRQLCQHVRVTPPGNRVSVLVDAGGAVREWDSRR